MAAASSRASTRARRPARPLRLASTPAANNKATVRICPHESIRGARWALSLVGRTGTPCPNRAAGSRGRMWCGLRCRAEHRRRSAATL
jgi:hypothetical protein